MWERMEDQTILMQVSTINNNSDIQPHSVSYSSTLSCTHHRHSIDAMHTSREVESLYKGVLATVQVLNI